jgi:hypothetical protein
MRRKGADPGGNVMPILPALLRASMAAAVLLAAACSTTPAGFSLRLAEPRLAVVDATDLTEAQRDMLASRSNLNIYRTLAHHVDLYNRWSPLGQVLLNNQSISPRHREAAHGLAVPVAV